jgi:glycosyltransferase involved in cell wall biosynthesis
MVDGMSGSLRVELVSHASRASGGAVLSLVELATGLAERPDMDVGLVLPHPGPLEDRLPRVGVRVSHQRHTRWVVPPGRRWYELRAAPHLLREAVRSLRQTRPDVVLTNTLVVPGAALAARAAGIPHVWRIAEFARRDHPLPFALPVGMVFRMVNRLSQAVIVPSHALAEEARRYVSESRVHVVPPAVDLAGMRPPTGRWPPIRRLIIIGRLSPVKRAEDALKALRLLVGDGHDLRLSVFGSQEERDQANFASRARDLGIRERVVFHGHRANAWESVGEDSALLSCSGHEGFARATIEAMKHSVPVVAAAGGANAEHVRHGHTGLLYPLGEPAGLADRVARLCRDPELRPQVVGAAYDWASSRFTRARYASAVAEILHQVTARR